MGLQGILFYFIAALFYFILFYMCGRLLCSMTFRTNSHSTLIVTVLLLTLENYHAPKEGQKLQPVKM